MKREIPDKCTLCGSSFELDDPSSPMHGQRIIYPYPMKEYLCRDCFRKSLDAGLNRLNKVLAGKLLTKDDWKPSRARLLTPENKLKEDT